MDRRMCWLAAAVSAWLAGGCDAYPGGRSHDRVLAPGELSEPIPVELGGLSFELRSAALGQSWTLPGTPGMYTVALLEQDGGCGGLGEWTLGRGPRSLYAWLPGLSDGSCRPGVPCEAYVYLDPGSGRGTGFQPFGARAATLTLSEPFSGWEVAGELRASFYRDPEIPYRFTDLDDDLLCVATDGRTRVCVPATDEEDCCNEGKPLEDLVLSVSAPLCPEAVVAGTAEPRAIELAVSCPAPAGAPDCGAACAHEVDLCRERWACGEEEAFCTQFREGECVPLGDACPATCAAASSFPVFATAFACLETSGTVDAWTSCMASCGGDR